MSCGQHSWLHALTSKLTPNLTAHTQHRLMFFVLQTQNGNELALTETTEQSFTGRTGEKRTEKCTVYLLNDAKIKQNVFSVLGVYYAVINTVPCGEHISLFV